MVQWDWNVAVFCRNERGSVARCIDSIVDASRERRTLITLIVNGSTDDSATPALDAAHRHGAAMSVFVIAHGDKANAINHFLHTLREPARYYFFLDAYVKIGRDALTAMETCLASRPEIVAATGIAMNGRTMRHHTQPTLNHGARLHGQMHALRPDFVERLTARRLRLPIGLYYGDGLMGSMAMHDLDPLHNEWDPKRIGGSLEASYEIPTLSPFRVRDLRRQFQRKVRQMRGRLENLAIRGIVYQHGYEGLPEYADDMVNAHLSRHATPGAALLDRPFQLLALRQIREASRPDPALLRPVLMQRLR
jgi:hypothetical protein